MYRITWVNKATMKSGHGQWTLDGEAAANWVDEQNAYGGATVFSVEMSTNRYHIAAEVTIELLERLMLGKNKETDHQQGD